MPVLIDPSKRPQRILAVLGMHRSGTSCLTGSLQAGGLFLGKHHTWNEYNRKGNRENQDVVNLHENIFKQNGASWIKPKRYTSFIDNWFDRPMQWHDRHYARAQEILAEYAHEPLWGFKDPRALFLLHGWKKMIPDIEFVGIFRHPMAVAQSLNSRPALPITIEQGLQMWLAYNRALLKEYEQKSFPLFCFDWSEDEFHDKLNRLHEQLHLKPIAADQRFYTGELHKQKALENASLPEPVLAMYQRLKALVYAGFDSAQPAGHSPGPAGRSLGGVGGTNP